MSLRARLRRSAQPTNGAVGDEDVEDEVEDAAPDADPDDDAEPAATTRAGWARWRRPLLLTLGALVLVGIGWVIVTGLLARSQLDAAKAELPKLRRALTNGDTAAAHRLAKDIRAHAERAHDLTTGPAWYVAAHVPLLGTPADTGRTIAAQVDLVGRDVLPRVLDLADRLSTMPRPKNSTIDLARFVALQPDLDSAAATAHRAARTVDRADGSWLPTVSSAQSSLANQLDRLDGELSGAARTVRVLPVMLGNTSPQRYFVGFLNEAESRGLGGLPGAYAIATADHGRITFTRFGTDDDLRGVRVDVSLGADYLARYTDDPLHDFRDSDSSPDFSDAARIWAAMWQQKFGEQITGAIAIDPTALSYLLKVTGPFTTADGTRVSAYNIVDLAQRSAYSRFSGDDHQQQLKRKAFLVALAKGLSTHLTRGGDPRRFVRAMTHAVRERRFVVWSADPKIEAQLRTARWAGEIDPGGGPLTGFVVNNGSGGKIDYYLRRAMTYHRTDCGAGGTATATFTVTNGAPASGLPRYVTTRLDDAPPGARPGSEMLIVTYYGSPGALVTKVTIDGRPIVIAPLREKGLITATLKVELAPGQTRRIEVTVREPEADAPVQVLEQPLVNAAKVSVTDRCH